MWSSSEAKHNCVAISGCHATDRHFARVLLSVSLMIGSFFFRSQMTHFVENTDAKMCCTCRFQANDKTSSSGWHFVPGVIGFEKLFKSQIKISDSIAPLANKFVWKWFKSKVLADPFQKKKNNTQIWKIKKNPFEWPSFIGHIYSHKYFLENKNRNIFSDNFKKQPECFFWFATKGSGWPSNNLDALKTEIWPLSQAPTIRPSLEPDELHTILKNRLSTFTDAKRFISSPASSIFNEWISSFEFVLNARSKW